MENTVPEPGVHDIAKSQFFIILDHGITAYIKYKVLPHNGIHFLTTQVPESHKGQGLAKILVKDALNFCVTNKIYFKSSCWYINAYIGRNPSKSYNKYFKIWLQYIGQVPTFFLLCLLKCFKKCIVLYLFVYFLKHFKRDWCCRFKLLCACDH